VLPLPGTKSYDISKSTYERKTGIAPTIAHLNHVNFESLFTALYSVGNILNENFSFYRTPRVLSVRENLRQKLIRFHC